MLRKLLQSRRGGAAMSFAVALPIMISGMGLAIDYSLYRLTHSRMQAAADAAALAAVADIASGADVMKASAVSLARRNVPDDYGNMTTLADITVGTYTEATGFVPGTGASVNAARVVAERSEARGNVVRRIFSVFISRTDLTVTAEAIAARPQTVFYEPPALTNLDNEAGDFNELYAYCYDTTGSGAPDTRRTQMTLISNNLEAGSNAISRSSNVITANPPEPEALVWPRCEGRGQTLSFRLRNIRHAKSIGELWRNPGRSPGRPEHNHYTDTTVSNGRETFAGLGTALVETVRCDTLDKCDTRRPGHVIPPQQSNRNPQVAAQPCEPGKFMYFGWEDRPPGQSGANRNWTDPAWTDRDYNDIVVVVRCPRNGRLGDGKPRLVG